MKQAIRLMKTCKPGWINYKTFDQKSLDPHMNPFGGEDRLWLGPEGGKFSLFFRSATKMEFYYWHTPAAFDFESWVLAEKFDNKASMTKVTRVKLPRCCF